MEKRTSLYDQHMAAGAKMAPFAGYSMPIRYAGDQAEHLHVRSRVGLFDVSHMGEFLVRGPQAQALIHYVTSNDPSRLPVGKAQYSTLLNPQGGIVDDLIVYHLEDELFLLVVNASNVEKDWAYLNANNPMGAELEDISEATSLLALSGPDAPALLARLTDLPVDAMGYYACSKGTVAGLDNLLVCTTGYTGEKTYELMCRNAQALDLWNALFEVGRDFDLQPAGLAARDTLRLEMGYMLYGNDIDDTTTPLEAGLNWITRLKKAGHFIGADVLRKQSTLGVNRRLIGFVVEGQGIPRRGYELYETDPSAGTASLGCAGMLVGTVTSGGYGPSLKQGIGMAYVPAALAHEGQLLELDVRGRRLPVRVVSTPFITTTSVRQWFPQRTQA